MSKNRVWQISMALAGLVLLAGPSLAAAGQWVVIAAEGTSLQPGALLDGNKPVKLADGAQLTLLAEDGKTLKLTGPYSGAPGNSGATGAQKTDNLTAIASLLQGHRQSTSTLGVTRNSGSQAPSAELINVDSSGERCLSSDPVVLWRGGAANSESVTLTDARGQSLASFTWPAGEVRLPVPGHYFEDGKSYLLQRGSKSVSLQIHKAATPANPATLAAWMAKNGCKAQALSLLGGL